MARASRAGAHPRFRPATLRRLHTFIGVFIAPSLLFFAMTGALQLFGLHEAHGSYEPPAVIEGMAKVHKDQVFAVAAKKAVGEEKDGPARHHGDQVEDEKPRVTTLVLKAFFLVVAGGLISSTCLGLWMALIAARDTSISWLLFAAGVAIPAALVIF